MQRIQLSKEHLETFFPGFYRLFKNSNATSLANLNFSIPHLTENQDMVIGLP